MSINQAGPEAIDTGRGVRLIEEKWPRRQCPRMEEPMYVDEYFDGLAEYQAARARAFAHIDLVYRYGTQMTLDAKKKPKPRPRPRPGNGY